MFHDMRCCVYVQAAPGGDLGCRVYVAGGTLVRREKREAKIKQSCCDCMTWIVMFMSCYVMVYLGDGSGIAVMPSVPILVVCITKEMVCQMYMLVMFMGPNRPFLMML